MTLSTAIIDDEPLARECIESYVKEVDFLSLAGAGSNPVELLQLMGNAAIDLVFLDIQMPLINGIDFLKTTRDLPMVIITTAYPSYALEGFQLDVMDYLVKPITFDRFLKAANKAKEYHQLQLRASATGETSVAGYFFVKCGFRFEKIFVDDILYVEALQNYVTIFTTKGKFMTLLTLKQVEQNLDDRQFIRVHKSYVISMSRIAAIENNEIYIEGNRIPISRQYRDTVMQRVVNSRLWKK
ncbi:MAG: LytTR family DNA-binding domain-containing protein [Chryseolinea sp.]